MQYLFPLRPKKAFILDLFLHFPQKGYSTVTKMLLFLRFSQKNASHFNAVNRNRYYIMWLKKFFPKNSGFGLCILNKKLFFEKLTVDRKVNIMALLLEKQ